jgi:transmembrane 9 superfamily protein 1
MYTLFGILALAAALLVLVTAFVVIALTYFQLAAEDWRWPWRAWASGGMVGVFVFAYGAFFFVSHSEMSGFLQTAFYFGYMAVLAWAFVLAMGAVGYLAAAAFVHYIYGSIKTD